jgi:hypothetical protein
VSGVLAGVGEAESEDLGYPLSSRAFKWADVGGARLSPVGSTFRLVGRLLYYLCLNGCCCLHGFGDLEAFSF